MLHGSQNNAMSECALALAMAFFSIMVLTMVSMGGPRQIEALSSANLASSISIAPSSPIARASDTSVGSNSDAIIIHYRGRFLDTNLKTVDPAILSLDRPLILAIEPTMSMVEAIAIRERVPARILTVTILDERWLAALKEISE